MDYNGLLFLRTRNDCSEHKKAKLQKLSHGHLSWFLMIFSSSPPFPLMRNDKAYVHLLSRAGLRAAFIFMFNKIILFFIGTSRHVLLWCHVILVQLRSLVVT